MAKELVLYEVTDGVATVTLNDPEKRNMLSGQMLAELVAAMERARDDEEARAVVLTGAGEKAFCAGADLGGFASDATLTQKHFASDLFLRFFRLMPRLGKPSLCAANGHVLAGGMGLALSCDLVIARENATFGTPEINVGAFPYMIMAIIFRNVPRKKVNEMMLLGERLSPQQAVEYGLANKVVPAAEFDDAVADWAGQLASKSPLLMRLGHDAIYRQQDMAVDDALDYLRSQLTLTFSTEDTGRGRQSILRKARPGVEGTLMRAGSAPVGADVPVEVEDHFLFERVDDFQQGARDRAVEKADPVAVVDDRVEVAVVAGSRGWVAPDLREARPGQFPPHFFGGAGVHLEVLGGLAASLRRGRVGAQAGAHDQGLAAPLQSAAALEVDCEVGRRPLGGGLGRRGRRSAATGGDRGAGQDRREQCHPPKGKRKRGL